MDEVKQQVPATLEVCAIRLSAAAESLGSVLKRLEAQYKALDQKVSRIVAAVDEEAEAREASAAAELTKPQKTDSPVMAAKAQELRKTASPVESALLAKGESDGTMNSGAMDKALRTLSVEQRITVKSELARMGMLS